jgi:MOSC domain-containing protein YiiM
MLWQKLCVGEGAREVSAVCHPCEQIEALRRGLQAKLEGRRGMLCRVLTRGTLRHGNLIQWEEKTPTAENPSAG